MRLMLLPVLVATLACGVATTPTAPTSLPSPAGGTTVGATGGTVTSADGRAVLRIPPGALASPVSITLVTASELDASAASPVYQLGPAGTSFAVPAELTIALAADEGPLGVAPDELRLHVKDGSAWRAVEGVAAAGSYRLRWPGPSGPCTSPAHAEFDFWLGTWNYVVNGNVVAPNVITRSADGCLVHEFYAGGSGRSISYRGRDGAWYQTYVSANLNIRMRGALEGRRMVLYGSTNASTRFFWDPVTPDRVRYVVETTRDGGATWQEVGPSEYVRR
jgi:hypothetical protein